MNENDLFRSLSESRLTKKAAAAFLKDLKEKRAGLSEVMRNGAMFANNNRVAILGLIGGIGAGALEYNALKPGKDGQPSKERESREQALASSIQKVDAAKSQGKEPKFSDDLLKALRTGGVETSKVLEKHPKKGALLMVPIGVGVGTGLGALTKKFFR